MAYNLVSLELMGHYLNILSCRSWDNASYTTEFIDQVM
jgi:hypothetical protein